MYGRGFSGSYNIGIYVRESRDDNEENYDTIETQRDLLIDFVKKNNMGKVYKVYMDDNVSGSGFERKGIEELKEDVAAGNINLVALKDLSRLGRNNAKTLLFLDYLEEFGVRVITFDGRYDSIKDNETVGIETWFNERYIKDISKKIRANLRFKIEKGEYIGHAPYGYTKSTEEKNRLIIDENTAPVVKEIYVLYREGYGYASIAKLLSTKGYPPPSNRNGCSTAGEWNQVAVQRILCNRVYIGDTVQGISEKVSFKSKKTRRLPQSKWVLTRNTHEAIITEEEFEAVRRIREKKRIHSGTHKGILHLLRGLIYCGRCGSPMFARVRKNRPVGYICGSYSKKGKQACSSHYVSEELINGILSDEILELLKDEDVKEKTAAMLEKELLGRNDCKKELLKLEQQIVSKQKQQDILYSDRLEGKISEQLFTRMNANIENRISQLRHEIEKTKSTKCKDLNAEEAIVQVIKRINERGITREMVSWMVERIIVFDAGDGIEGEYDELFTADMKDHIVKNGAVVIDFKFNSI
ncbi:MAG: recombinase family protein [Clostridia bacterium]|nr:recombinase family protein [Clostridia bacterium]